MASFFERIVEKHHGLPAIAEAYQPIFHALIQIKLTLHAIAYIFQFAELDLASALDPTKHFVHHLASHKITLAVKRHVKIARSKGIVRAAYHKQGIRILGLALYCLFGAIGGHCVEIMSGIEEGLTIGVPMFGHRAFIDSSILEPGFYNDFFVIAFVFSGICCK